MKTTMTTKNKQTKVKRATANEEQSLVPDANLAAAAMQRQRDSAEAAARLVDAEGPAIGLITAGVMQLCASAFPDAIGAKLVIEQDEYQTVELHLPVHPALTASPATVATEPVMTAEQLKDAVRAYANKNLPGWACSGISFRLGEIGAHITETLVVLPTETTESGTVKG